MENHTSSGDEIAAELRALGANLKEILRTAWESEDRKRIQGEVEVGLQEMAAALKGAADEFAKSPAGQQLQADAKDLHERVRSGEVGSRARQELLSALRKVNAELEKTASSWSTPGQGSAAKQSQQTEPDP